MTTNYEQIQKNSDILLNPQDLDAKTISNIETLDEIGSQIQTKLTDDYPNLGPLIKDAFTDDENITTLLDAGGERTITYFDGLKKIQMESIGDNYRLNFLDLSGDIEMTIDLTVAGNLITSKNIVDYGIKKGDHQTYYTDGELTSRYGQSYIDDDKTIPEENFYFDIIDGSTPSAKSEQFFYTENSDGTYTTDYILRTEANDRHFLDITAKQISFPNGDQISVFMESDLFDTKEKKDEYIKHFKNTINTIDRAIIFADNISEKFMQENIPELYNEIRTYILEDLFDINTKISDIQQSTGIDIVHKIEDIPLNLKIGAKFELQNITDLIKSIESVQVHLRRYSPILIQKSGLKHIAFLNSEVLGNDVGGFSSNYSPWIVVGNSAGTLDHELAHQIDKKISTNANKKRASNSRQDLAVKDNTDNQDYIDNQDGTSYNKLRNDYDNNKNSFKKDIGFLTKYGQMVGFSEDRAESWEGLFNSYNSTMQIARDRAEPDPNSGETPNTDLLKKILLMKCYIYQLSNGQMDDTYRTDLSNEEPMDANYRKNRHIGVSMKNQNFYKELETLLTADELQSLDDFFQSTTSDRFKRNSLHPFPNPTNNGQFTIPGTELQLTTGTNNIAIKIFSTDHKLLKTIHTSNNGSDIPVDLGDIANGIYIIEAYNSNSGGRSSGKIEKITN